MLASWVNSSLPASVSGNTSWIPSSSVVAVRAAVNWAVMVMVMVGMMVPLTRRCGQVTRLVPTEPGRGVPVSELRAYSMS